MLLFCALGTGTSFADTVQAWLLISYNWSESLLSTDPKEKATLEKAGWKLNGTVNLQRAAAPGTAALHRLARTGPKSTERMLEADPAKLAEHVKAGYHDEGPVGFVATKEQSGLRPVQHYTKGDNHLWLIDAADQATAEKVGWKLDGISFWAWPVAK